MLINVHYLLGLTLLDGEILRTMAAISSSLLVAKIYDWLRLFENTGFYVQLLEATVSSIGWFMLLFLVALLVFGLPLSMLSLSREGEDERIMDYTLFFWLYDVLYN